jgi:hypothetical protein
VLVLCHHGDSFPRPLYPLAIVRHPFSTSTNAGPILIGFRPHDPVVRERHN